MLSKNFGETLRKLNRAIERQIINVVISALNSLRSRGIISSQALPDVYLDKPRHESHGDFSCNIALRLAKSEGKQPMEMAEMIAGTVRKETEESGLFSKIETAKPGFINFSISNSLIKKLLKEALNAGMLFGRSDMFKGKSANVEFVSANPTGPLTVGHGRHAVVGDTIANVLHAAGYKVEREYYFNNAGNQMNILGDSVRLRYLEKLGEKIIFPDTHYQGDYIRDIAEMLLKENGEKLRNSENVKPFKERAEKEIFKEIDGTLKRIGVVFDRYFNENSLYETGKVAETVSELRSRNLAYDKDGAVWFKATEFGLPEDKVIIKSTGEPTYRMPDICYHIDKIKRGYDLIVDIFGQDHHATVPEVQAGVKALGFSTEKIKVILIQFVTLTRKGVAVKMSTRKANYVTLDEMISAVADEMRDRLSKQYADVEKRFAPEDFDRMARDAVRYFYIMRKTDAHLNFDLDLATSQSMENPVYYIQYAHARICSIFKKYYADTGEKEIDFSNTNENDIAPLKEEKELKIIKMLARFPRLVEEIATSLEIHRLHDYLTELASELQQYYTVHRVLNPDNRSLTHARLALIHAVRNVIQNALALLGISAPESM